MDEGDDIKYMRRCLELAAKAEGLTYPNPMVGAVIVYNDSVLGEGYHIRAGEPHAEVNAINSVSDKSLLKSSTLYVNLEPCSHFGKTPPCSDLIISHGINDVVIGTTDTSSHVSGKGIEKLRNAGCRVKVGILEKECRYLNRRFFSNIEKKRPYVILKWAQSTDGYIDRIRRKEKDNKPVWITGNPEKVLVHRWRACEQAILAGAGTIRADNPQLNVREWTGNQPLKVVLSRSGAIGQNSAFSSPVGTFVVFTSDIDSGLPEEMKILLDYIKPAAEQIGNYLYSKGIQSLFVEGGAEVLNHFIDTGYWDEARVFKGNFAFSEGIKAPELRNMKLSEKLKFGNSDLEIYLRNTSDDTEELEDVIKN
ncbi:MAG TPA: bifunctional diaminohydroxyphosphoribosylaminopyrimidine deaminase/5-amino-6-(5-phosphoribosylamino)uracil reductase RibD [Bacteroidales bacterium]|nr:bifunctional diaminohydroxyphosphoribosylaminopyrimidine deaminase/5-amino-6-(5-phosphoribosylamino)uracil reductase RibD [Bacteroidales bacterium]